jgi:hypothetical protein
VRKSKEPYSDGSFIRRESRNYPVLFMGILWKFKNATIAWWNGADHHKDKLRFYMNVGIKRAGGGLPGGDGCLPSDVFLSASPLI